MEGNTMKVTLGFGRPDDADRCWTIFYEAFKVIAEDQGFPEIRPVPRGGSSTLRDGSRGLSVIVAELDGHIVGSNLVDERLRFG